MALTKIDPSMVADGGGGIATNTALGSGALQANTTGSYSVAIGDNALYSATTGANNTAVGYSALYSVTSGNVSTAVGYQALYNNVGVNNTAVGKTALVANTTGVNNTAVGVNALQSNTTGYENTAIGLNTLYNNTYGNLNSGFGKDALFNCTTGNDNTAVGMGAGYSTTGGNSSTFIGRNSGYSTTGGQNTFIGHAAGSAVTTGSKNTIVGRYDGNAGGLDIRTGGNYAVISDGDGSPLFYSYTGAAFCLQGAGTPQGGCGVQFPATQNPSANANTLDDYEEGTWTPTFVSSGATFTYAAGRTGVYTKVGNVVTVQCYVSTDNVTGRSSSVVLLGELPFPCVSGNSMPTGYIYSDSWVSNYPMFGWINGGSSRIYMANQNRTAGGNMTQITSNDMSPNSGGYNATRISITYLTS